MPINNEMLKKCEEDGKGHLYTIGLKGDIIICERCGRIKAVKEESWKVLY